MVVDVIFFIILAVFMLKGYAKGAVLSLFAFLAILIGIWGALKLSGVVALLLSKTMTGRWIPMLAYLLVFIAIVWLIRLGASVLQKSLDILQVGFINKLMGALLYGFIVCFAGSALLWLMARMDLEAVEQMRQQSIVYNRLMPLAPWVYDALGQVLPFFKSAFEELSRFFDTLNLKIESYVGID